MHAEFVKQNSTHHVEDGGIAPGIVSGIAGGISDPEHNITGSTVKKVVSMENFKVLKRPGIVATKSTSTQKIEMSGSSTMPATIEPALDSETKLKVYEETKAKLFSKEGNGKLNSN